MKKTISYVLLTIVSLFFCISYVNANDSVCNNKDCIKCSYQIEGQEFNYLYMLDANGGSSFIQKNEPTLNKDNVHYSNKVNSSKVLIKNNNKYTCANLAINSTNDSFSGITYTDIYIATKNDSKSNIIYPVITTIYNDTKNNNGTTSSENGNKHKDDFNSNCKDFAKSIRIGGYILLVVKIILPIIIIIKSSFSMLKVVTEGNQEIIKKQLIVLFISLISAFMIFFVPTIVSTIMKIATDSAGVADKTSDSEICRKCVFEPLSEECNKYIK